MPLIRCTFWDHQRIRMSGGRACTRCGAWLKRRPGMLERHRFSILAGVCFWVALALVVFR